MDNILSFLVHEHSTLPQSERQFLAPLTKYLRGCVNVLLFLHPNVTMHKTRMEKRVAKITYRTVFGMEEQMTVVLKLSKCSQKINKAFPESLLENFEMFEAV